MIKKELKEKLEKQSLLEIDFAREYKSRVLPKWRRNDVLYSGKKNPITGRSNINIASIKTISFVNTLLSKVDAPPNIKFSAKEEADYIKARRATSLLEQDFSNANENIIFKDLLIKKQSIKYGRGIFEYHASSEPDYNSHLSLINPYDFLIDPMAGGLDLEKANFLGRTGIIKKITELQNDKKYDKKIVKELIENKTDEETIEEKEKAVRFHIFIGAVKKIDRKDEFTFVEWYTTYEGERYYLLINEQSGLSVRTEKLTNIFKSGLYPYASFATDPDDEEFWTPSPLDVVSELFMGQHVLINQQIDNNEAINDPMKAFDVNAVKNPNTLKWRRGGNIPMTAGTDIRKAFQVYRPDFLRNNESTYNLLDTITQTTSGITADLNGLSEEKRVGIYEGNLEQAEDRLGLLNKSYVDCYSKLGILHYYGAIEHLNKKISVKILGVKGLDWEDIKKSDMSPKKEYDVEISSSDSKLDINNKSKENRVNFITKYLGDATKNQNALFEMEAEIVGLSTDEIKKILDVDVFGDAEIISEAATDFQLLLSGKTIDKPNSKANIAYKQYFSDAIADYEGDIKDEIVTRIIEYIDSLQDTITRNTVTKARQEIGEEKLRVKSTERETPIAPTN